MVDSSQLPCISTIDLRIEQASADLSATEHITCEACLVPLSRLAGLHSATRTDTNRRSLPAVRTRSVETVAGWRTAQHCRRTPRARAPGFPTRVRRPVAPLLRTHALKVSTAESLDFTEEGWISAQLDSAQVDDVQVVLKFTDEQGRVGLELGAQSVGKSGAS